MPCHRPTSTKENFTASVLLAVRLRLLPERRVMEIDISSPVYFVDLTGRLATPVCGSVQAKMTPPLLVSMTW
jgi:hypothetical protein